MSAPSPRGRLELLAPAGSEGAFFAAVEAGADSVYLGIRDFNARLRAKNFSLRDLETLIPYAHSNGVQVYLTVNTLIKESELSRLVECLMRLETLRPDALIVQDYGVAMLAQQHAPSIPLHASTQMTIHNSAGAGLFAKLGFARVILARECTLEEITAIGRTAGIELEVFAHGALCYSYSGQCYFSSYLGGASANRGRCTQPCRRSYKAGKNEGAYFSPKDLCFIDRLPELVEAGVAAIKIEGRLRTEANIHQIVSAYREGIDALPGKAPDRAIEKAREDFSRAKSYGHFDAKPDSPLINPSRTAAGRYLGKVTSFSKGEICFTCPVELNRGDRLRITQKHEGMREGFTLSEFSVKSSRDSTGAEQRHYRIPFEQEAGPGDQIFLVGHKGRESKLTLASLEPEFRRHQKHTPELKEEAKKLVAEIHFALQSAAGQVRKQPRQIVRAALPPGSRDIIRLMDRRVDEYIVPLKHREIYSLPRNLRNRVVLRIPVFIREREQPSIRRKLAEAVHHGFTRFLIGNPAHITLLESLPAARMQADYTFHALNSAAVLALARLGIELICLSLESDTANTEALEKGVRSFPLELVSYGRPPLFTSLTEPPLPKSRGPQEVKGSDETILVEGLDQFTIVMPKTPFSLMGVLKAHQVRGFAALRLELSSNELLRDDYDRLRQAVSKWQTVTGAKPFNYHPSYGLK